MGWYDIKSWFIGGAEKHFKNSLFGFNKKYKANQADKAVPFEEGYATSSDVYAIVNKIATNAKLVPWRLRKVTNGETETIESGDLYDLMQRPNKNQNRQQYTEEGLIHLLLSGNLYFNSLVPVGFKRVHETYLLHPQRVEIKSKFLGRYNEALKYIYRVGGKEIKIEPNEITHEKFCNPTQFGIETLYGLSPLVAGYLTVVGLNTNAQANASILDNQGAGGILSNESDYALTPEQRQDEQESFDKQYNGAENFGKIIQSGAKVKYTRLGLDPTQLKIIESKLLKMRDLCNVYDVRAVLFNDITGSTFNNVEAAEVQLWTSPIPKNLNMFIEGFNREVVSRFNAVEFPNGSSRYYVEADYSEIEALQSDKKLEAEKDKTVMEGYKVILDMPISMESKRFLLVKHYDFTIEEAMNIVPSIQERLR